MSILLELNEIATEENLTEEQVENEVDLFYEMIEISIKKSAKKASV